MGGSDCKILNKKYVIKGFRRSLSLQKVTVACTSYCTCPIQPLNPILEEATQG